MGIVEYQPGSPFPGVIGRTTDESSTAWPAPVRARQGVPNVLTIVLDDTGYGQHGCYGSGEVLARRAQRCRDDGAVVFGVDLIAKGIPALTR